MNDSTFTHTPFVVLLVQAFLRWRAVNAEDSLQDSGSQQSFKQAIRLLRCTHSEESIKEANSIYEALKADERVGEVKATKIWATFQEKVQEAANLPEPSENISTSESTAEQVESQEETPSVTEEAVNLLSSPAFSLDALLGMNLAIDED